MRVTGRVRRSDRGAVLIIVAVFALVAVVFLAFVVDIGDQRQDRRQLATATDASALDVAQEWANNSLDPLPSFTLIGLNRFDCTSEAQDFLNRNRQVDAGDYRCEATFVNPQSAVVSVYASGVTDYQFGPAVGVDEGPIGSMTTVRISSAPGGGLRPFAICSRDEDVVAWFVAGGLPRPIEFTLGGDKFLPNECGQNSGNWGFVQFESQASGVGTTRGDGLAGTILNGTVDPVSSYDNGDLDYDEEKQVCVEDDADNIHYDDQNPVTCVFQFTGAGGWNDNNTASALQSLVTNETVFNLPVYAERADLGGSETGFPVIAFAEVQLVAFDANGANNNSVTLRFLDLNAGDCCAVNESNQLLEICDVGTLSGGAIAALQAECLTPRGTSGSPPNFPEAPDPCAVQSVSPLSQTVSVGSGNAGSTAAITYEVTVDDADDCSGIVVAASGSGTPADASLTRTSSATFDATFAAGTRFNGAKTYIIEVRDGGTVLNNSARLTTN